MTDEDNLWQSVGCFRACFGRFKSGEVRSAHERPAPYQLHFFYKKTYLFSSCYFDRSLSRPIYKLLVLPFFSPFYLFQRFIVRHKLYQNPSLIQTSKLGGSLVILTCLFSTQLISWWEWLLGFTQDMSWGRSRKREI